MKRYAPAAQDVIVDGEYQQEWPPVAGGELMERQPSALTDPRQAGPSLPALYRGVASLPAVPGRNQSMLVTRTQTAFEGRFVQTEETYHYTSRDQAIHQKNASRNSVARDRQVMFGEGLKMIGGGTVLLVVVVLVVSFIIAIAS